MVELLSPTQFVSLGKYLKYVREEARGSLHREHQTGAEVAQKAKVSQGYIARIESGEFDTTIREKWRPDKTLRLMRAYGVTESQIRVAALHFKLSMVLLLADDKKDDVNTLQVVVGFSHAEGNLMAHDAIPVINFGNQLAGSVIFAASGDDDTGGLIRHGTRLVCKAYTSEPLSDGHLILVQLEGGVTKLRRFVYWDEKIIILGTGDKNERFERKKVKVTYIVLQEIFEHAFV